MKKAELMRWLLIFAVAISGSAQLQALSPQVPIVSAPITSAAETLLAAKTCGLHQLRTDTSYPGEVRFFLVIDATPTQTGCVAHWVRLNGKRLHFRPRWEGDTFEHDHWTSSTK